MAPSKGKTVTEGSLNHIDPSSVLADDNSRFGLKETRIESMAASIIESNGVKLPIEVQPHNGKGYPLTSGFYRLAGTLLANKQGAGLTIPALIVPLATSLDRLRRQLSENMERENQSPMDKAVAIKRLLDEGVSKMEIRTIFTTPGGRKGLKLQPASNSFINMTLSFLGFSKDTQSKIHLGLVGVGAAYQLTRVSKDKQDAVLAAAEKEREASITRDEKEEESFLSKERRGQEAVEKAKGAETDLEKARESLTKAEGDHKAKVEAETAAYTAKASLKPKSAPKKTKDTLEEAFRSAASDTKAAERAVEVARKAVTKGEEQIAKTSQTADAAKARLKKLQDAKSAKDTKGEKAVSSTQVKKAAQKAGAGTSYISPSAKQIRDLFHTLSLPPDCKVREIGKALHKFGTGEYTDNQLVRSLQGVVGEVPKSKARK